MDNMSDETPAEALRKNRLVDKLLGYADIVRKDALNYNTYLIMSKIANQLRVMAEGHSDT